MTTDNVNIDRIVSSLNDDQHILELNTLDWRDKNETYDEFLAKVFGSLDVSKAFARFAGERAHETLSVSLAKGDPPVVAVGLALFQGLAIGYRYGRDHVKESDLPL